MNNRYEELKNIAARFPFLKDKISTNIREVYSDAEFLDYRNFVKEYDYETDLFGLAKRTPSFSRGYGYNTYSDTGIPFSRKEIKLLYQLISFRDTSSLYENNYDKLIEICNVLIDDLKIDESKCEGKHFNFYRDESTMTDQDKVMADKIKGIAYLASFYAMGDPFIQYLRHADEATGKSQFIVDLFNDANTVKEFNRLCFVLDVESRGKYYGYNVDHKPNACNTLNSVVTKVYDTYPLEEIEKFKEKAKIYSNIFSYFHIETDREASILNSHISDDERNALTKDFTSADDIANLVKNVMNAFSSSNYFEADKINSIITNIIVNNKKIRDRDFPTTKNKVVHEFLRLLFVANSKSRDFTGNEAYAKAIREVINSNKEYTLDPYFITSLLMKSSVINDEWRDNVKNTKKLISHIFSSSENVLEFINNYVAELEKPETERVSSVKGVKRDIISYGCLFHILKKYCDGIDIKSFTGLEADNTVIPAKLLLLAYGRHKSSIRERLLIQSGTRKSQSSSYYYYSNDNNENIVRVLERIFDSDHCSYTVVGLDGKIRNNDNVEQIYYGGFNHVMSYLTADDEDFEYNINNSFGVRETSRWGSHDNKEIVPKDYVRYVKEAAKIILLELYKYIIADYGTALSAEQLEQIKTFITQRETTIKVLPDTMFANIALDGNPNKKNALNKEYASDVTDYGCLNYVSIPILNLYVNVLRDTKSVGNPFTLELMDDTVLLPEVDIKYYDNYNRKTINERAAAAMEIFNSLTTEEYSFFKPLFIDNFADGFAFTRTMQVCLFANMLNAQDKATYTYEYYNQYLVDSYALQTDVSKPQAAVRAIDYTQVFFVNVIYPKLLALGLITAEQIHDVEDSFNKAYTDYDCLLSLR